MKKKLLCAAALCAAGLLSAADFRIDIGGEEAKMDLEIKECSEKIRASTAGWLNERKKPASYLHRFRFRSMGNKKHLLYSEIERECQSLPDGNHQ